MSNEHYYLTPREPFGVHDDSSGPMDYNVLKIKKIYNSRLRLLLKLFSDDAFRTVLGRVFHSFGAE